MPSSSWLVRAISMTSAAILLLVTPAAAQTINGLTFSVASDPTNFGLGSFFRTNGTGSAELGNYTPVGGATSVVRALSEFNVTGRGMTSQATLSFRVATATNPAGLPTSFSFGLTSYQGDNLASILDYQVPEFQFVGPYTTSGYLPVGLIATFDVTSLFNQFVSPGNRTSLGFRLSPSSPPNGTTFTLDQFQLTLATPQTTVPEPATLALVGVGFLGIVIAGRRRRFV